MREVSWSPELELWGFSIGQKKRKIFLSFGRKEGREVWTRSGRIGDSEPAGWLLQPGVLGRGNVASAL